MLRHHKNEIFAALLVAKRTNLAKLFAYPNISRLFDGVLNLIYLSMANILCGFFRQFEGQAEVQVRYRMVGINLLGRYRKKTLN